MEAMTITHYLTIDEVLDLHNALVKDFESAGDPISPAGPRDKTLLSSALSRPKTSLGDKEKYSRIEEKAVALLHSLIMNHPFYNGNKRTALVSMLVFLDKNGRSLKVKDDEIFNFILSIASRSFPYDASPDKIVDNMVLWIKEYIQPIRSAPSSMAINDFIKSCVSAGAKCKQRSKNGGWNIQGPSRTSKGAVMISGSTRKLDGSAIKRYLQKLGLSEGLAGIHVDEFQEGLDSNQKIIRDYRTVLKRLAHV
ncbi:MAG: hypothetical protein A3J24_01485 [Deltaproteobacteria bacterium RIFCSPLOWO2_02_FULL_53_8]|nr:MAG: hypothetical protein A3J24_01485 [Deltaproteobacteria bacterium RIFCSPLOWO2_02_FULL_53_8]